jgi:hypothetical protein
MRALVRLNYYKCLGNIINNNGIPNISNYCTDDENTFKILGDKLTISYECRKDKIKELKLKYFLKKIQTGDII